MEVFASRHHLTAAVHDDRTGCWYHYRRGVRVSTASVIKVEIMAGALLRSQQQGRGLTNGEAAAILPMIRVSDNATASRLFASLGGARGVSAMGDSLGLRETVEVGPVWGLSSTTAEDQARLLSTVVQGPGPLDDRRRGIAWWYLRSVRPDQRWGVTAGVPAGWDVGLKNGFAGSRCCRWRVNSVGYVADPQGGGYSIAILSDQWPSLAAGIPVVSALAARVAANLTIMARHDEGPTPGG